MKSYTDITQSKKLAEILPINSADMRYAPFGDTHPWFCDDCLIEKGASPCWSLSALLNMIPDYTLQTNRDGTVFVICENKKPMFSDAYDNPVDACYNMILKLNE